MKRRGFLGLMGGAAVAGPGIAKDAVQYLPSGLSSAVPPAPYGGIIATTRADSSGMFDRATRIADLRRLISGQLTDEEREERRRERLYNVDTMFAQNVTCLRSVSPFNKVRIHSERMQVVKDEIDRSRNRSYLDRLLRGEG
jgi:hypothetical protein